MADQIPTEVYEAAWHEFLTGDSYGTYEQVQRATESAYAAGRSSIHAGWAASLAQDAKADDPDQLRAQVRAQARAMVEAEIQAETFDMAARAIAEAAQENNIDDMGLRLAVGSLRAMAVAARRRIAEGSSATTRGETQ